MRLAAIALASIPIVPAVSSPWGSVAQYSGMNLAATAQRESPAAEAPVEDPALERGRALANEARSAKAKGNHDAARARAAEAIDLLLPDDERADIEARAEVLADLGTLSEETGDLGAARRARERVLALRSATLPADDSGLQWARLFLAGTLHDLGDLEGAQALEEQALEVFSRTLPAEHPDLQSARVYLASTCAELGDLPRARALEEQVLEVSSRTLPDRHPNLQVTRLNLADTKFKLGDLQGARVLQEKVVEVFTATLPSDHPDLQIARLNLAATRHDLGDLLGARIVFERVLEVMSKALPDENRELQWARGNLASTIKGLGDLAGARALEEKVLEVYSRTLPDDNPDLQRARMNLAGTLRSLGDLPTARALEEKMLEVLERTLPDDHYDLNMARGNLALTIAALGETGSAREIQEQVLGVFSRSLSDDHPALQTAREHLSGTLRRLGDFRAARSLTEQVLDVRSRTLPDEHPDLQMARQNLALTLVLENARALRSGPTAKGEQRENESRERCTELVRALCRAQVRAAQEALLSSSSREAEERCVRLAEKLDVSLSFVFGWSAFEPWRELEQESFALAETTRAAALASAVLARQAAGEPNYAALRQALGRASDELARLARAGTTSAEFDSARGRRDAAERELVALARERSGGELVGLGLDVPSLARRLGERTAAVGFRRFTGGRIEDSAEGASGGEPAARIVSSERLCAFVVRGAKPNANAVAADALAVVDLGPIEPIERAVDEWRGALGITRGRGVSAQPQAASGDSTKSGETLRRLVLDPLLPALGECGRIVLEPDGVLHVVPLDALPFDENSLLGDHWQIETRTTLAELFQTPEPFEGSGLLVAFGDVEYGAGDSSGATGAALQLAADDVEPRSAEHATILRGSAWSDGFTALPGTGVEVRGIARCFHDQFGADATAELCEQAVGTRERLLALAQEARWLHIATHGWFATESIPSWNDSEPLDKQSGLGSRRSGEEQVKRMSPMLLCGLALAGANSPEDAVGRVPGLVTAEELSTLDLTNCELVVLSACDTNVGERRAGQGVASLQKALQMAGARSVITSLWKVPDEATKELMLDFYRRLWVEKKPKGQALWEAKVKLRNAKDERGEPLYTTRDWAAWVLTGDPR